jgi:hypothetical protein
MRRSRRTLVSARVAAPSPLSRTKALGRHDVTQPDRASERSPKEVEPESGQEQPESYAAAALNVVNHDSSAVSDEDGADARGQREETE